MENPKETTGLLDESPAWHNLYQYTMTAYPAALNSALLLATPAISPALESPQSVAGRTGLLTALQRPRYLGPSNRTALLFGAAQALGAWMIYDGDLESGSGFLGAWSALYMIVGGRGSVKALRYGRVWPLLVTTLTGANAYLYGRRFITNGFT